MPLIISHLTKYVFLGNCFYWYKKAMNCSINWDRFYVLHLKHGTCTMFKKILIYKEILKGANCKVIYEEGLLNTVYEEMRKYLVIYSMRRPLVIYTFSPDPFWISSYMRKISYTVHCILYSTISFCVQILSRQWLIDYPSDWFLDW